MNQLGVPNTGGGRGGNNADFAGLRAALAGANGGRGAEAFAALRGQRGAADGTAPAAGAEGTPTPPAANGGGARQGGQAAPFAQQFQQGRGGNNQNSQAELLKRNEELLDKVAASLKPEQRPVVKKLKYDQIKARGGADRMRAILEEEGTPLTPEQFTQLQAIFNAQNQALRQYTTNLVQEAVAKLPPAPPTQIGRAHV